nr:PREDICTED: uncharacterized protein LOC107399152 [Tribolium castaneum]XP_015840343.1 PREDICTED: uncharacterized protein LOC107399152 [Tribolium castaneum]XP_015840344.1 PREDICTED: uncharacterized protein LOC107399152 [Tribolium castaneum]|eukprot:XP_015840342.1 PREDICTED: uncharacterized protein LOC107399152 [Tribolium castaneum]
MHICPSVGTLKATLRRVPIQPGICKPIFQVLKRQIAQMKNKRNSFCTIVFDEISFQPHLDYLCDEVRIIGFEDDGWRQTKDIADHVCVFMLRGIYKRWKQPVAFAFCKSSIKAENIVRLYKEVVKEATEAGLNVIASICDQGTNNVKAINLLLDYTRREASLKDEEVLNGVIKIDNQTIIPLFDPPHLLKSLRNNLLTKELQFTQDGKTMLVKWSHIIDAYRLDQHGHWRCQSKLTIHHVIPHRTRKMKVSLAAQVFSHSVSSFMILAAGANPELFGGRSLPEEARDTAKFLKFIDNIFDSVNGGIGHVSGKHLRGLVTEKSSHYRIWLQGKRMFSEMEFVKSKPGDQKRPPVLDGWCRTWMASF